MAEIDIPFYPGLKIGVPSVPAIVEALAEGRYDVVHVCSPGPAGIGAWLLARVLELPRVGSYHTELGAYAGAAHRAGPARGAGQLRPRPLLRRLRRRPLAEPGERRSAWPSSGSIPSGSAAGTAASTCSASIPRRRDGRCSQSEVNVLYAGRLTKEKGVELLADAFLEAHRRDPALHLVLAGGGPEEELLRERLGDRATFLGWLSGDDLARAYASADVFPVRERNRDLRAGDPRGAGQRPAGRRGRPGRPARP